MDPFTPRSRGAGGRKRNLGLSAKEYTKVNAVQTYLILKNSNLPFRSQVPSRLYAVIDIRKTKQMTILILGSMVRVTITQRVRVLLLHLLNRVLDKIVLVDQNDSSFIAETSFVRAPLNSRVVSNANAPKVKGKGKQEPLDRVPLEIQEAMILEDLLFVLTVPLLFPIFP